MRCLLEIFDIGFKILVNLEVLSKRQVIGEISDIKSTCFICLAEFKGHCLLEGARQADATRVKKYISPEQVAFKHPYTEDTPLVSE